MATVAHAHRHRARVASRGDWRRNPRVLAHQAAVAGRTGAQQERHQHGGEAAAILLLGGAGAFFLWLLLRGKHAAGCPQYANFLVEGQPSGRIYAVDASGVFHYIQDPTALANCGYCSDPAHLLIFSDAVIAACKTGADVTDSGGCVAGPALCAAPTPTPTPTPDPWLTWWAGAGADRRSSVAAFYCILGHPPSAPAPGTDPYPVNPVMYQEEGIQPGSCTSYNTSSDWRTGLSFRITSDCGCEFFNLINASVGGPTYPRCSGTICANEPSTDATTWLNAAGAQILGYPWLSQPFQLADWTPAVACGLAIPDWQHAVLTVLLAAPQYLNRLNLMAAAPAPPWMPGGHPGP